MCSSATVCRGRGVKEGDRDLPQAVEGMLDCRRYATDLALDVKTASKLLQHSSVALTKRHCRTKTDTLKPVR